MDTFTHQSVADWFEQLLQALYPRAEVETYDTHTKKLNLFISSNNLQTRFHDTFWRTFEIKVDVTGFVTIGGRSELAFVSMTRNNLRLEDLFMFMLCCRVADPIAAYLISPQSMSTPLHSLLVTKGRSDILIYYQNKRETRNIVIGRWNEQTREVDPASKRYRQAV